MQNVNRHDFQTSLIRWFQKHKRKLPWRKTGIDPYRIFVVEVMLQQTQIKTVIPYYERWLKSFPNVCALASAPLDRVLKLWEGLGYYSRARNLHQAAQIIAEQFGGRIPSNPETLMTLPGIGRYTAGAIASIAFQKPVPLVDGNVARVFSRLFYIRQDIAQPKVQERFYKLAESLLPQKEPGIFNQALMELGSLVCIPEMPRCHLCPVTKYCGAFKKGNADQLPIRRAKTKIKEMDMVVGIIRKNGYFLIRKRPNRGIWGGLWEIPGTVRTKNQTPEEALRQELSEAAGMKIEIEKQLPPMEHRFTHRKARIYPFVCRLSRTKKSGRIKNGFRWADRTRLKTLSFPRPHQKILNSLSFPQSFSGNLKIPD